MVNQDILNYLKSGIASKMKLMELKSNLISNGWAPKEVELAISELTKESNTSLSKEDIILPKIEGIEDEPSLAEEVNIPEENIQVKNEIPIKENIPAVALVQEDKNFWSRKNIVIICVSFFLLIFLLILIFGFSSGSAKGVSKNLDTVKISNGTTIEFSKNEMNIEVGEKVVRFKIVEVMEYIIKYELGELKGELFMKEDSTIDFDNDGINDTTLRLERIEGNVPTIFIKES